MARQLLTKKKTRKKSSAKKSLTKTRKVSVVRKKGHIVICQNFPYKSSLAKMELKRLHKLQGKKGFVKIPGKRKVRILDKLLRRKARGRTRTRGNILSKLRRKHKKKKRLSKTGA